MLRKILDIPPGARRLVVTLSSGSRKRRSELPGWRTSAHAIAWVSLSFLLFCLYATAVQTPANKFATSEAESETPKDTLGRDTPRGAVLGFLAAARRGNSQVAALYLQTPLRGASSETLAEELAAVLDRRLPARLTQLSDKPEGSLSDPLLPNQDLVGTIETDGGNLDIVVERVDRGKGGKVWLFSKKTLDAIPDVFQELSTPAVDKVLPKFLVERRLATIPLFEWLAVFVGVPLLYLLTGLLSWVLGFVIGAIRRRLRKDLNLKNPQVLPRAVRLLLVARAIRWLKTVVGLSLLARQFWSTVALMMAVLACMWLLTLVNSWGERYLAKRRQRRSGSASVLRLIRRVMDGVVLFSGLLFILYHFGINPTAALAGAGVGGIAVALAAQKTLENVVAGVSLIADQAVRVGDTLKLGDMIGTVEDVGLRSTRIRTTDRTMVSVPNGQIANMSVETLSARDNFWFHPVVGLRYETGADQLRIITSRIHKLLDEHPSSDSSSVRVRFIRLGAFSLDIEVVAYFFARDWNHFLEIQEELLLHVMEIVHGEGAEIAFPSQTMYIAGNSSDDHSKLRSAHSAGGKLAS